MSPNKLPKVLQPGSIKSPIDTGVDYLMKVDNMATSVLR